ncbi:MAG: hypothetical protein IH840_04030 [Candidatus Heimdallarchaeota archaeon]|nr:hypothetical protein [Candidatus Heimdallarchaeota archaeon]
MIDFDKTISTNDVVVELMELYGDPGWQEVEDKVETGEITLRECMEWELNSIEITKQDYVRSIGEILQLDIGAKSLFTWIGLNKYPVHIISDSLTGIIEYAMEVKKLGVGLDYKIDAHSIIWTKHETISHIHFSNEPCIHNCANCKVSKVIALKKLNPNSTFIYIGDGFTDILAAHEADRIYARKDMFLADKLVEANIAHHVFLNLYGVLNDLKAKYGEKYISDE